MKVSLDFDSTLDREDVQAYARHLISQGVDVRITTARGDDTYTIKFKIFIERYTHFVCRTLHYPLIYYIKCIH